eukprot:gene7990-12455_t
MKLKRNTNHTEERKCLLIKNLGFKITELDLLNSFEQFGIVSNSFIPKNKETGESRGFGYITFEGSQEAQNAHQMMHRQKICGRTVLVMYSKDQTMDEKYLSRCSFEEDSEEDTSYLEQPLSEWTKEDVVKWIETIVEVSKEVSCKFLKNEISGDILMSITGNDLKEIGIEQFGIRKKIGLALNKLYYDQYLQKKTKNETKKLKDDDDEFMKKFDQCFHISQVDEPTQEELKQELIKAGIQNLFECPTEGCDYLFENNQDSHFRCNKCRKHYCLNCKCEYHNNMTCNHKIEKSKH